MMGLAPLLRFCHWPFLAVLGRALEGPLFLVAAGLLDLAATCADALLRHLGPQQERAGRHHRISSTQIRHHLDELALAPAKLCHARLVDALACLDEDHGLLA